MLITEKKITGFENLNSKSTEPMTALIEFYQAFNTANFELMSNNWESSDEASMSNPLGDIKRGWSSIKEVYSNIFSGKAKVYVAFHDYSIHHTNDMFCAVGHERGFFQLGEQKTDLTIRTSRIYRMNNGRWQQVHHHGSIDDPKLLAIYQEAVLGKNSK